jgi:hypothetical protein
MEREPNRLEFLAQEDMWKTREKLVRVSLPI